MRTTQDDGRENKQIKLFGLTAAKGRSNKYTSDASVTYNGKKYMLELKSSDVTKGNISTSRDFGRDKIEAWKINDGFIFSQFRKTEEGDELTGAGLSEWEGVYDILEEHLTPREAARIERTFEWGTKLNDPKMRWSKLKEWGTLLDAQNPRKHLRELLTQENK